MPIEWRVYGNETVAAKLDKAELPGFWKNITVGPDETALLIRNGAIDEIVTEQKLAASGIVDRIKGVIGRSSDVTVAMIDTSPRQITLFTGSRATSELSTTGSAFKTDDGSEMSESRFSGALARRDETNLTIVALTADGEPVVAELGLTVSISPEKADLLLGLFRNRNAISSWDITQAIKDEVLAKVLVPELASLNSQEIRGNRSLLETIGSKVSESITPTLGLWGLQLRNFYINWGLTDTEVADLVQRSKELADRATEFDHLRSIREMEREIEIEKQRATNLQELRVLDVEGDQELVTLLLASAIERGHMQDATRIDTEEINARIRLIELDVSTREQSLQLDADKARSDAEYDLRRRQILFDQDVRDREQRRSTELADTDSQRNVDELAGLAKIHSEQRTAKSMERIQEQELAFNQEWRITKLKLDQQQSSARMELEALTKALDQGNADIVNPDVFKAMFNAGTDRTYATESDEKVQARADAQAAGSSLDLARTEQDRAFEQQSKLLRQTTDAVRSAADANRNPSGPDGLNSDRSARTNQGLACGNCQTPIQPNWVSCPECGTRTADSKPRCKACQAEVEPNWRACPMCSTSLT